MISLRLQLFQDIIASGKFVLSASLLDLVSWVVSQSEKVVYFKRLKIVHLIYSRGHKF